MRSLFTVSIMHEIKPNGKHKKQAAVQLPPESIFSVYPLPIR